jgi:hypothetical protein
VAAQETFMHQEELAAQELQLLDIQLDLFQASQDFQAELMK